MNLSRVAIWRLTFWYVLITMCISVSFSVVVYQLTARHVRIDIPPQGELFRQFVPLQHDDFDRALADVLAARYQREINHLRVTLFFLNLGVLASVTGAGYFLAKRTLQPIERAMEDQRRFAADASHELRTPLAAMKAEIEVALQHGDAAEKTRTLESTLEEVDRMEKLSTSLLRLARHEDATLRTSLTPLDLGAATDEAVRRVAPVATKKGATIDIQGEAGTIIGDHAEIVDVLVILLDNALKYSPANKPIAIKREWSDKTVAISVIDQGIGMAPEDMPHIFERFYRADASRTKHQVDGHGLGLPIAKQIVERHRGTIRVTSVLGQGTTMTVVLPRNL